MKISFNQEFKSIRVAPIEELPKFTVITGENGAGKTHFLSAIYSGFIQVSDIDKGKIAYYSWTSMVPVNELGVIPRRKSIPQYENFFISLSSGVFADIRAKIRKDLKLSVSITKEQLINCLDDNGSNAFTEEMREKIVKIVSDYRKCLIEQITQGSRGRSMSVRFLDKDVQYQFGSYDASIEHRSAHYLYEEQCIILLKLLNKKHHFFDLSIGEFPEVYPITEGRIDPFRGSLSELFASYINEREKNDLNEIRFRRGDAEGFLSENDFLSRYGLPPWDVLNEVLANSKLAFRFKKPNLDSDKPLEIKLVILDSEIEISYADLSSGERILISLSQFIFLSSYGKQSLDMPELILLDEVDAPMHPSMTADLLRVLVKVLVEQYDRRVILATHSPSTVALAPEESLFVMEKVSKKLRKVSRDEAIHTLTAGVPVLSVKLENRRQVFVESEYDVLYYERIAALLKKQLSPEISFVFIGSGTKGNSSCDQVKALVKNLTDAGSHIVFGIVDWDLHNYGNEKVRVLGREQRYSIENYLFDPLLVAILAYQLRLVDREALTLEEGQTFADLRGFDNERLQVVVDNTLQWLGFPTGAEQAARACTYINGRTVNIPIAYLEMQGHALEARIRSKAPVFNKFNNDSKLKLEILDKVLYELPGFLSRDFLDLLSGIQTS